MLTNNKFINKKVRMSKAHWQKVLNIFFFIMMGFGLYFIVARSGFEHFLQSIRCISFGLGLVLIALNVLVIFLVGWRLAVLLETVAPGISLSSISKINVVALASGYASIGKLNAPIKAVFFKKGHHLPFSSSTPVLVAEQMFDLSALMLIGLIALALSGPYVTVAFQLLAKLSWTSTKVIDLILAITFIGSVGLALTWVARRKIGAVREMIAAAKKLGTDRKMLRKCTAYTACIHLTNIAAVTSVLYFLGLRIELGLILLLTTLPMIAGLFSPVPGGLGVREFIFAGMYTLCFGDGSIAVAAAFLTRIGFFAALPVAFLLLKCFMSNESTTLLT